MTAVNFNRATKALQLNLERVWKIYCKELSRIPTKEMVNQMTQKTSTIPAIEIIYDNKTYAFM